MGERWGRGGGGGGGCNSWCKYTRCRGSLELDSVVESDRY